MFENTKAFCSFSVNDTSKAKKFYESVLGLKVTEEGMGDVKLLTLHLVGGGEVMIYPKPDHTPASFTVLNFPVMDIEKVVKELSSKGIKFEKFDGTDEQGITHNEGPLIAWFKDPAGNFLSVIEDKTVENKIVIDKFIPTEKEKIFAAWTNKDFLEKWSFGEGMKLFVELFEPKVFGKYIFKHTSEEGVFFTTGIFKEFIRNERLVYTCKVKGPDGVLVLDTLVSVIFADKHGGTDIHFIQEGFTDRKVLRISEAGWLNSLENLFKLMVKGLGDQIAPSSERNMHQ
jgi:uncharacterized protein YndB with AHSA1/START domain/predicted enzyme related to lactoylglutathione lyase